MTNQFTPEAVRAAVEKQADRIKSDLTELVSFNSVHAEEASAEDNRKAAAWVVDALQSVGLEPTAHDTADGSVAITAHREPAEGKPTVLLYSHYDVVPAGDPEKWESDPFTLTERDGRWYGRGTADCKGNIAMHLAALRAVEELGGTGAGITAVIEGSEEKGGVGLDTLLEEQPELFRADVICIADVGNQAVGVPTLTSTLRGGGQVEVTVDTLRAPAHSGNFGGPAPDAVSALIRTLNSLRDDAGRTVIDGTDTSQKWEGAQYDADAFRADAGVLEGVELLGTEEDTVSDLTWARPTITVTGFTSTPVAEAVNAVPATASAKINLRVPPHMDAEELANAVARHVENHTPWGAHVKAEVVEINAPFSTDPKGPFITKIGEALAGAYGKNAPQLIGSGGSIPLTTKLQERFPDAEIALYGVEEPTTGIHSPNESVDPTEIHNIAVAEASFLLGL